MPAQAAVEIGRTDESLALLNQDEIDAFHRDGYLILRNLADARTQQEMMQATLDGLQREIEPIEYEAELHYPGAPDSLQSAGGRTVRRLKQAHSRRAIFTEWIANPELAGRLRQLLGPQLVVPLAHHNCIMTKQPDFSSDTGWHQDIRYWSYQRPELISVWLALTPERAANGCLRLIPGSQRLAIDRGRLNDELFFRDDLPENQALIATSIAAELDPGDTLLFHARTLHAATRNHSKSPKYSVVFTYRPFDNPPKPGTRSASLPELLIP